MALPPEQHFNLCRGLHLIRQLFQAEALDRSTIGALAPICRSPAPDPSVSKLRAPAGPHMATKQKQKQVSLTLGNSANKKATPMGLRERTNQSIYLEPKWLRCQTLLDPRTLCNPLQKKGELNMRQFFSVAKKNVSRPKCVNSANAKKKKSAYQPHATNVC